MEYRPLEDGDREALCSILIDAFGTSREMCLQWMAASPQDQWRVLCNGQVRGGLLRIPMAQYYGGTAVQAVGIAGVAVDDTCRGSGVGQKLMGSLLRELSEEKAPLSILYASTSSFYRRNGYDRAGSRVMGSLDIRSLRNRNGPLVIGTPCVEEVERLYGNEARHQGAAVRGPYLWRRVRQPRMQDTKCYGFYRGSSLEGYALVKRESESFHENSFEITDLLLTSPDSVDTFLGFLAGYRAFFQTAHWPCRLNSPLFMKLDDPWQYGAELKEQWMLRLVDLKRALEDRGYPLSVKGELHLRVADGQLDSNRGDFILRVEAGRGILERGGEGRFSLDIGALASLYTGFQSPRQLQVLGRLKSDPESLSIASESFRGETFMLDMF